MVLNHRKKTSRQRGSWTHGNGGKKKARGAGNRGGRGNAGSGKRGDAKKPSYWKIKNFAGKHGFTSKSTLVQISINLGSLDRKMESFVNAGFVKKEGDFYVLDCKDIKVNKLLGTGSVSSKLKITVDSASKLAIEKVASAGGEVIIREA